MTDEYTHTDLATRLAHLRRVVIKKSHYFAYTAERLKQADPQFRWLDANKNPRSELRGISMSFRAQRGILSKIPHYVRDDNKLSDLRGERSEEPKPEEIEARTLRNNLVHEYTEDVDVLRQSLLRALELIPMLETVTKKLCQESRKQP